MESKKCRKLMKTRKHDTFKKQNKKEKNNKLKYLKTTKIYQTLNKI